MKALSFRQPWASMIADGTKTIETRKWSTKYRGDLLICSSQTFDVFSGVVNIPARDIYGHALCVVKLVDCVPMTAIHEAGAKCAVYPRAWAWILEDVRTIQPFPVKGKLGLFEVEVKTPQPREENTGRYKFANMDLICECGHTLGVHAAARVKSENGATLQDCLVHDVSGGPECHCQCFKPVRSPK